MSEKKKTNRISLMSVWILITISVSVVSTILFTSLVVYRHTQDIIEATDERLLMAAEMAREIVGPEYHNSIKDPTSISAEQFNIIVERNDDLCRRLGLQYLWSVLVVDDQFVFTTATHSDVNDPASSVATFYEVHRDPDAFQLAMNSNLTPVFSTFDNEWGKGRQVLIPRKDESGRIYIFGASIQLIDYEMQIFKDVMASILIGLTITAGVFLVTYIIVRRMKKPIIQLIDTATEMASGDLDIILPTSSVQELQSLANSLDELRINLKQRILELNKSNELLDASQRISKVGGWEWNVAQGSLFWTDEVYRIHQLSPEEFPFGSPELVDISLSCYGSDGRKVIHAAFLDCIEKGLPYSFEVPFTNYKGERLWVLTKAEAVKENDQIVRVVGNIMDITERKKIERLLKESNEVAQAILNASTESVFLMDIDGIVLAANETTAVRLGKNVVDLIGSNIYGLLPPEVSEYRKEQVARVVKEGKPHRFEDERFGVWIENSIYPIFSPLGEVIRVAIFGRDISEHKEMEDALAYEADFNQRIFNSSNIQMAVLDSDNVILAFNASWHDFVIEIAGLEESTLNNQSNDSNILNKLWGRTSIQEEGLEGIQKVQNGELSSFSLEYPLIGSGNIKHWFHMLVVPLQGRKGSVLISQSEITKRKLAEEAQQRSETFFRTIFEKSSVGYSLAELDGVYIRVNPTFSSMLGYSPEEMVGKNWAEFTHPDDIQTNKDFLFALQNDSKNSIIFEKRYLRKDGSQVDALISLSLLRDDKNENLYFLANILDVGERKRLLQEREYLSHLVDKSPASITIHDMKGNFLYANEKTFSMHGYSRAEFLKLNVHQLDVPESEALLELRIHQVMQEGEASFEVSHFRKDGSTIPLQVYARRAEFDGEKVIESIAIDLSERTQMEKELRESEERYKSLHNASFGGIAIHDQGIILECNQGLSEMMGYSIDELRSGMDGLLLIEPNSRELVRENIRIGYEKPYEVMGIRKNGEIFPLQLEARNIPYKGKMLRSVEFRDISAQKRAEEKIKENQAQLKSLLVETEHSRQALLNLLEDQKEAEAQIRLLNVELEERVRDRTAQLESSNKELEAFSYSVSHDLRAPLRGIDGWSLALFEDYQDQLDEKGREFISRIRIETERMGHLIEDLLRLSRITRMEMEPVEVDLSELSKKITERLAENYTKRVKVVIQKDLTVLGDPQLLDILLENLLSNAFKFSSKVEKPRIEFGIKMISGQSVYFIRDNGAGFDMEYAKNLFGAFQRLHKQTDYPGTGIGLAIVQRIVNRHGGKIWPESKVNQGTTFYFTLSEDK